MLTAILGALGVVIVALLTFFGSRLPTLSSQREDFQAIIGPLRDEISDLRERVKSLESKREEDQKRFSIAIQYIRDLLAFIRTHTSGVETPPIPPELNDQV